MITVRGWITLMNVDTGSEIYLQVAHITCVRDLIEAGAIVEYVGDEGSFVRVRESPEEVMTKIAKAFV